MSSYCHRPPGLIATLCCPTYKIVTNANRCLLSTGARGSIRESALVNGTMLVAWIILQILCPVVISAMSYPTPSIRDHSFCGYTRVIGPLQMWLQMTSQRWSRSQTSSGPWQLQSWWLTIRVPTGWKRHYVGWSGLRTRCGGQQRTMVQCQLMRWSLLKGRFCPTCKAVCTMSSWSLKSVGHVKESSSLYTLSPMLRNGLIEVSSRIKQVMIPDAMKHPVLLPQEHRLSRMITEEAHNDAHLGLRRVLSNLRKQFWIIGTQNLIKKVKHQYVTCYKLNRSPTSAIYSTIH